MKTPADKLMLFIIRKLRQRMRKEALDARLNMSCDGHDGEPCNTCRREARKNILAAAMCRDFARGFQWLFLIDNPNERRFL